MIQGKARNILFIIIMAVVVVIGVIGTREPSVTVKDGQLSVSGLHGVTVGIDEIQSIEKITDDSIPVGSKIFGLNFGNVRKGRYHYGDKSSADVFLESDKGPYIFITLKDDMVIMNFKQSEKTEEIYKYLKDAIKK